MKTISITFILLVSLAAQLLPAQGFNLGWIDEDAAARTNSLKRSLSVERSQSGLYQSGIDVKFHRILLTLDPAIRFVTGSVSTYYVPRQADQHSIVFDMLYSLKVTAIRYHGALLTTYSQQDNKLIITLPSTPFPANPAKTGMTRLTGNASPATLNLDSIMVDYQGVPVDDGLGTFTLAQHDSVPVMYTLSEPYGAKDWWPCSQELNDKIDSVHLVITVPPGYRAAANGMLVAEQHCDDRSIYQWKHKHPIAAYLVGISITNYAVYSDYVPVEGGDSIEILNYVYPEDSAFIRTQTPNIIRPFQLYNQLFGLYPFADERYGHAQWNWGGGMEHQTMSFMGSFGYDLMAHELAHQWFGDFVTCGSWRDIWLNEGFATYLTGLCYERDQDGIYWEPFKRLTIKRVMEEPGGSVFCYDTTVVDRIFDARLSYSKGAMVMHMLRWEMGDGNFFRAMNKYLHDPELANGYATTEDLIRHAEAAADTSFREFFNDWVFGQGYPTYRMVYRPTGGTGIEIEVSQEQSDPSVSFFEMDLPVVLYGGGAGGTLPCPGGRALPGPGGSTLPCPGESTLPCPGESTLPCPSLKQGGVADFRRDENTSGVTVKLHHTYSGQVFRVDPGFKVDSVKFDPERWICTANPVVLKISEIPYDQQVKIFPNPVTDQLTVQFALPEEGLYIRVYNQKGQLMFTGRSSYTSPMVHIPMHSFARGIYTVEVEGRKAVSVVKE
jgi:hypothetical protein